MDNAGFTSLNEGNYNTRFNLGIDFLQRINSLLYLCLQARFNYSSEKYINTLESLYIELEAVFTQKEYEIINTKLKKAINEYKEMMKSHTKINRNQVNMTNEVKSHLVAVELELRKVLHRLKLLLPQGKDPAFAINS